MPKLARSRDATFVRRTNSAGGLACSAAGVGEDFSTSLRVPREGQISVGRAANSNPAADAGHAHVGPGFAFLTYLQVASGGVGSGRGGRAMSVSSFFTSAVSVVDRRSFVSRRARAPRASGSPKLEKSFLRDEARPGAARMECVSSSSTAIAPEIAKPSANSSSFRARSSLPNLERTFYFGRGNGRLGPLGGSSPYETSYEPGRGIIDRDGSFSASKWDPILRESCSMMSRGGDYRPGWVIFSTQMGSDSARELFDDEHLFRDVM